MVTCSTDKPGNGKAGQVNVLRWQCQSRYCGGKVTLFIATVKHCPARRSKGNAEYCKVEQSCGNAMKTSAKVKHGRAG